MKRVYGPTPASGLLVARRLVHLGYDNRSLLASHNGDVTMNFKKTLIASAIALAFGLSSGLALANPTNTADGEVGDQTATATSSADGGGASANEYSQASAINDSDLSNSSDNSTSISDSGNDSSDNSTAISDSGNTTVSDSGNDNSDNSQNVSDSGNDSSDNSTNVSDSGNDNSDNSMAHADDNSAAANNGSTASVTRDQSDNSDNSTAVMDSGNSTATDSFNTTLQVNAVVSQNELSGTVTGNHVDIAHHASQTSSNSIGSDSFGAPAGITQVSQNSGANSLTQQQVSVQAHLNLGN